MHPHTSRALAIEAGIIAPRAASIVLASAVLIVELAGSTPGRIAGRRVLLAGK